mmetsp:Transcript_34279/g.79203  ORF Transcript_34279/g.79203 Transcript_34279/m.79203 type:complete len:415 (+) Transcript_34279:131-1375(+)
MRRHSNGTFERLIQYLAQGRMRVHHHAEFLHGGPRRHSVGTLLDEVSGMQSNDVHGHNLPRPLVVEHLGDARPLPLRKRLGVRLEAAGGFPQLPSLLLCLFLRLFLSGSHHGDLRMREAGRRDGIVVNSVFPAAYVFDGGDALGGGSVSEHHLAVGVSDAVEVGHDLAGVAVFSENAHVFVYSNEAARGGDSGSLEAHFGGVGNAAGGDHGCVDLEGLHVFLGVGIDHLDCDWSLSWNSGCDLTSKDSRSKIDRTGTNKHPLRLFGDLPVKRGHDHWQGLDERHLRSQSGVHVAKLQTDVPRPDDGHVLWHELQVESSVRSVHRLLVHFASGRHERHRPRRQHYIFRRVYLSGRPVHNLVWLPRQHSSSLYNVHPQSHQRVLEVSLHPVRQVLRVCGDAAAVKLHAPLHLDSQV